MRIILHKDYSSECQHRITELKVYEKDLLICIAESGSTCA